MNNFCDQNTRKLIKYILIGLIVIGATKYIPDFCLPDREIIMIAATISVAYGIMDMVYPSIKVYSKD